MVFIVSNTPVRITVDNTKQVDKFQLIEQMLIGLHFGEALFRCNRGKNTAYFAVSDLFFRPRLLYNRVTRQEVDAVTVRERILALRLLEKRKQNPDYAKRIGIQVTMISKDPDHKEEKHV